MLGHNNISFGKIRYPKFTYTPELNHGIRSSYEKKVCLELKNNNIVYYYEIFRYNILELDNTYTPDLFLPKNICIEIKGPIFDKQLLKMKEFKNQINNKLKYYIITQKRQFKYFNFADKCFDIDNLDEFIKCMKIESKFEINNIIVEGVDKSGKDSIIEEFHKLTDYSYPIINRLWATIFSHGIYNDRKLNFKNLNKLDSIFALNGSVLVYVTADTEILKERFLRTFEKDIKIEEIDKLKILFEEYLTKTKMPIILLNTSFKSPKETAKELLDKLNLIGKNGLIK
jgi:hypothetical protein